MKYEERKKKEKGNYLPLSRRRKVRSSGKCNYYFFHKFGNMTEQTDLILNNAITTLECTLGVTYKADLYGDECPSGEIDPIFSFLFCRDKKPSGKDILNIYHPNQASINEILAYHDLGMILSEVSCVDDTIQKLGYKSGLLGDLITKKTKCFRRQNVEFMLHEFPMEHEFSDESRFLSEITMNLLGSPNERMDAVISLWRHSYFWDSLIWSALLCSEDLHEKIRKLADKNLLSKYPIFKKIRLLENISDGVQLVKKDFFLLLEKRSDVKTAYHILKCYSTRLEKDDISESSRIFGRDMVSEFLLSILLKCLDDQCYSIAQSILVDFWEATPDLALADMFPKYERLYFKDAFELILDVIEMLDHVTGHLKSDRCFTMELLHNGLLGAFVSTWLQKFPYKENNNNNNDIYKNFVHLVPILERFQTQARNFSSPRLIMYLNFVSGIITVGKINLSHDLADLDYKASNVENIIGKLKNKLVNSNEEYLDVFKKYNELLV